MKRLLFSKDKNYIVDWIEHLKLNKNYYSKTLFTDRIFEIKTLVKVLFHFKLFYTYSRSNANAMKYIASSKYWTVKIEWWYNMNKCAPIKNARPVIALVFSRFISSKARLLPFSGILLNALPPLLTFLTLPNSSFY